jgi:hypothetical protein
MQITMMQHHKIKGVCRALFTRTMRPTTAIRGYTVSTLGHGTAEKCRNTQHYVKNITITSTVNSSFHPETTAPLLLPQQHMLPNSTSCEPKYPEVPCSFADKGKSTPPGQSSHVVNSSYSSQPARLRHINRSPHCIKFAYPH